MTHTCGRIVIQCLDFRFVNSIARFLEKKGCLRDCDLVSLAGAAKNLVEPLDPSFKTTLLKQIELCVRLHGISEVYLINHRDCGAYGDSKTFAGPQYEWKKHTDDLAAAAHVIQAEFPQLSVTTFLAALLGNGKLRIDEVHTYDPV